jgi:hypothetical protein
MEAIPWLRPFFDQRAWAMHAVVCDAPSHLVSFPSSALSTTGDKTSQGKNDTTHKLPMYLRFNKNLSAEFPAIAEESAPMIGTTMRGAGSAAGRTEPMRWEQAHGSRPQQAHARSTRRGRQSTRSRFEALEGNAQGFDF